MKDNAGKRRQLPSAKSDDKLAIELRPPLARNRPENVSDPFQLRDESGGGKTALHNLTPMKTRFASSMMGSDLPMLKQPDFHDVDDSQPQRNYPYKDSFHIKNVPPMSIFQKNNRGLMFGFRERDERDASGKKGKYRVNMPTRLVLYTSVIFLVVPLFAGLILIIRALLGLHKTETDHPIHGHTNDTFTDRKNMTVDNHTETILIPKMNSYNDTETEVY
jgi:hypothetical protein